LSRLRCNALTQDRANLRNSPALTLLHNDDGLELGPAVSLDGHQIGLTLGKQILVLLAHFTPLAVERKAPTNSCHRLHARRPRFAMHRLTPSAAIAALEPAITPRLCV